MRFVLDASVTCAWYLKNQATPYSIAVYDAVIAQRHQPLVPEIWRTEVSHVLIRAVGRRLLTREECRDALAELDLIRPEVRLLSLTASEIYAIHARWGTSGFDSVYLELARRLNLPVAAKDKPLLAAGAAKAGVPVFAP